MILRRSFLEGSAVLGGVAVLNLGLPAWARSAQANNMAGLTALSGTAFDLDVARTPFIVDGRRGSAITVNGQVPAPLLRWREGDELTLRVTNHLDEDTSIHWHGILLPYEMDGVPGVTFPGIKPGETFTYDFPVKQAGTYWYHSHSGLQEQAGHYGPLIIEPRDADPVAYDHEYVVVLSDWTFEKPEQMYAKLKKHGHGFNYQKLTLGDFFRSARAKGLSAAFNEKMMWDRMRMERTDILDITGETYTYLVNGHGPGDNWTALFKPGERVRLRFINTAAMSIFNVRIPGLPMTVVQADGQDVRPVETDEFQIGVAETYDVIVRPTEDRAFTIMCEAMDRSGYGRATLATRPGMEAPIPPLRERPLLTMKDMGMDHGTMDSGSMDHGDMDRGGGQHETHDMHMDMKPDMKMDATSSHDHAVHDHSDNSELSHGDAAHDEPGHDHSSHERATDIMEMAAKAQMTRDHDMPMDMKPDMKMDATSSHDHAAHDHSDNSEPSHGDAAHDEPGHDHSSHERATDIMEMAAKAPMTQDPDMLQGDGQMDHGIMGRGEMNHGSMNRDGGHMEMAMQRHDHPGGPGVVNEAMAPTNRLGERGLGLESEPHRVLVYTDLASLAPNPDLRAPGREMELHLTSNMERYMWSFDGVKFAEVDGPITFDQGERLRLTMVNDTMMAHPIHLHGMFFEVVTAEHAHKPRKHTIVIKPGEKLSVDITADAPGDWAFHCHLLYHMRAGMMRVVSVREHMGGRCPGDSHMDHDAHAQMR